MSASPSIRQIFSARKIKLVAATALIGLVLGSTLAAHPAAARQSGARDAYRDRKIVTVTAAFYPLAAATARVGGPNVKVTNLTPAGVEPHDLELSPAQVESVLDADLAVVIGNGFQPAVEDVTDDRTGPTLNVLRGLPISGANKKVDEGNPAALDPHVWLDPVLYGEVVNEIAAALSKVDPAHAAEYTNNATAYRDKLAQLNRAYETGLANCERGIIITAHEAFSWLAARYGIKQKGIAGISPDIEPNPRRMAALATMAEKDGLTTIFTEELISPKVARALARETGLKTATLNTLEGLTPAQIKRGDSYLSEMRANLKALQKGLGCSA